MPTYAVLLRFKEDLAARRLEIRPRHREYLASLRDAGTLVASGPWADDTGALLIYDVADDGELRKVLDADPYTAGDVYEIAELREWRPIFPFG